MATKTHKIAALGVSAPALAAAAALPRYGTEEGDRCNREGCEGVIAFAPVSDCSCHISAPCWGHQHATVECPVCGWEE